MNLGQPFDTVVRIHEFKRRAEQVQVRFVIFTDHGVLQAIRDVQDLTTDAGVFPAFQTECSFRLNSHSQGIHWDIKESQIARLVDHR
ncbi:hypothetical protein D3C86_1644500 [compost metagenome]